jgi:hypothetical protein
VWDPNFSLSSTFGCFSLTCSLVGGVRCGSAAAGPKLVLVGLPSLGGVCWGPHLTRSAPLTPTSPRAPSWSGAALTQREEEERLDSLRGVSGRPGEHQRRPWRPRRRKPVQLTRPWKTARVVDGVGMEFISLRPCSIRFDRVPTLICCPPVWPPVREGWHTVFFAF